MRSVEDMICENDRLALDRSLALRMSNAAIAERIMRRCNDELERAHLLRAKESVRTGVMDKGRA